MLHQILVITRSIELLLTVLINWCLILQVQNLHYKHINLNKTESTSKSNVNSIFKNVSEEYAAILSALGLIINDKIPWKACFYPFHQMALLDLELYRLGQLYGHSQRDDLRLLRHDLQVRCDGRVGWARPVSG